MVEVKEEDGRFGVYLNGHLIGDSKHRFDAEVAAATLEREIQMERIKYERQSFFKQRAVGDYRSGYTLNSAARNQAHQDGQLSGTSREDVEPPVARRVEAQDAKTHDATYGRFAG